MGKVPREIFVSLPELPDDVAEGFDSLKLALLRHRHNEWREISQQDALHALDLLRLLITTKGEA